MQTFILIKKFVFWPIPNNKTLCFQPQLHNHQVFLIKKSVARKYE